MKKTINGKTYNTETAEELGGWDNGLYANDLGACSETLYKTAKGALFLHGSGGAASSYSRAAGDNRGPGEDITPMTEEEALAWCEERECEEIIERHFQHLTEEA